MGSIICWGLLVGQCRVDMVVVVVVVAVCMNELVIDTPCYIRLYIPCSMHAIREKASLLLLGEGTQMS